MGFAVTSDTHAFHYNIIKYSNRPFDNVTEMNAVMAMNINKLLVPGDTLYHLGDWAFGNLQCSIDFRSMINPGIKIILIIGNHDERHARYPQWVKLFNKVYDLYETKLNGKRTTLCHYAMRVWNKSHHGAWHLYGHSHGSLADDQHSLSFDVGVDCHNFMPLTFEQIAVIMDKKLWKPVDHHGADASPKVWLNCGMPYVCRDNVTRLIKAIEPNGDLLVLENNVDVRISRAKFINLIGQKGT
jgi:calcineurin-like phosphoesterase family protein